MTQMNTDTSLTALWIFGDGGSSTNFDNITHVFNNAGTYNVSLKLTDDFGCSDVQNDVVQVFNYPTADFIYNPTTPTKLNNVVNFQNTSSNDVTNFYWLIENSSGTFEERLANLDFIIDTARPEDRNYIDRRQRDERAQIAVDIDLVVADIVELNEEKMPIQREQLVQEGEIGPIKYVAEMLYGEDVAKDKLDNAARILIFFIIFAFDPLAVLLLVGSLGIMARENDPLNPAFSTDEVAVPKDKIAEGNDYLETKRRYFPRK